MKRQPPSKALFDMKAVPREEIEQQLRMHRFAVQLYETLVERVGINHEEAQLALKLVEATNPDRTDVTVSVRRSI